ncbi:GntR family transcriptional regulator [Microbacterium sp. LMI1-1-1.1]
MPLMNTRRRASALVDEAYAALGDAIVDGRLQPGDRLRDVVLAEHMGISRTPVREALQRLERIGLVEVAANRYTRVSPVSERARSDMREYVVHMIATTMYVTLLRTDNDDDVARGAELLQAMGRTETSPEYVEAGLEVLTHFTRASRNGVFRETLRQADLVVRRNLEGWAPSVTDPVERADLFADLHRAVGERDHRHATVFFLALHGRF